MELKLQKTKFEPDYVTKWTEAEYKKQAEKFMDTLILLRGGRQDFFAAVPKEDFQSQFHEWAASWEAEEEIASAG